MITSENGVVSVRGSLLLLMVELITVVAALTEIFHKTCIEHHDPGEFSRGKEAISTGVLTVLAGGSAEIAVQKLILALGVSQAEIDNMYKRLAEEKKLPTIKEDK